MKKIVFVVLIFFLPANVFAEIIELKNGKKIEGKIIRETKETVVIEREEGTLVHSISKDSIKEIKESPREKGLWQNFFKYIKKIAGRPAKKKTVNKETEEYRLEKYKKEVQAAKEAQKRKKSQKKCEKEAPFRNFRSSRCRRRPCGK